MNDSEANPNATIEPAEPSDAPVEDRPRAGAAFVAAVRFLTRVPLSFAAPTTTAAFQASPVFFPLVGLLIGTFTAVVAGVGSLIWPTWLAVAVALSAEALFTGAFHEDALADFCDAFGGGWTREQTLTILKDSRVGAYGALGLFLGVALRWSATIAVMEREGLAGWAAWGSAVIAAGAVSRWVVLIAMVALPPVAQRESLSKDIGSQPARKHLLFGLLSISPAVMAFGIFMPLRSLLAAFAAAIVLLWLLRSINRRLGGITGDCLGCIAYITQVVVLLAAAARL